MGHLKDSEIPIFREIKTVLNIRSPSHFPFKITESSRGVYPSSRLETASTLNCRDAKYYDGNHEKT